MVESGWTECMTSGRYTAVVSPVPIASVRARPAPRPRSRATSAARRQARTESSAPSGTVIPCAARIAVSSGIGAVAPDRTIGIANSSEGSGSHTSNAGRGKTSGGVA